MVGLAKQMTLPPREGFCRQWFGGHGLDYLRMAGWSDVLDEGGAPICIDIGAEGHGPALIFAMEAPLEMMVARVWRPRQS